MRAPYGIGGSCRSMAYGHNATLTILKTTLVAAVASTSGKGQTTHLYGSNLYLLKLFREQWNILCCADLYGVCAIGLPTRSASNARLPSCLVECDRGTRCIMIDGAACASLELAAHNRELLVTCKNPIGAHIVPVAGLQDLTKPKKSHQDVSLSHLLRPSPPTPLETTTTLSCHCQATVACLHIRYKSLTLSNCPAPLLRCWKSF